MKKIIIAVIAIFSISSCTHRLTDFTIISTKNIDLSRSGTFKRAGSRITGKDVAHIVLFIPTGIPNLKEAIDRAIESSRGAVALVDGVVYSKSWFAFLYGQSMYIVEGTPLLDPSIAMNDTPIGDTYTSIVLAKDGTIKKTTNLSNEEFVSIKNKIVKSSNRRTFSNSEELLK